MGGKKRGSWISSTVKGKEKAVMGVQKGCSGSALGHVF
jgi:hypothetical protein